ncbi:MAG: UDP-N-acetylglucosamine--N-acetylmuramyl-(pentapeptide) pyrophosphoryl-undecaprenol N-acetylglucosamine transferase [bacterium]|nr:UDP-N-acetylglucosamine--N-acetylmuramyl-(pentapeptide) pyrophosphoryl-undecaprenol N-acetylglucosamine transferase [bacterium]
MKSNTSGKRIVITGGHLTPAFAVLELLKAKGWKIYWFGEKKAVSGEKVKTLEYKVIPEHGIPFYSITSAKLRRSAKLKSLLFLWKIPFGFFQSLSLLVGIKPDVLLSFGGYLSVPVVLAAWILRTPVILHEQTASPGLANKLVARFATKVAISFPGTQTAFPKSKVVLTGNPIRKSIFRIANARREKGLGNPPVLYITGGSRGSRIINQAVLSILPELLGEFMVYHQTGDLDFPNFLAVHNKLPEKMREWYDVSANYSFIQVEEIFNRVDFAVSRAGANSVLEFATLGVPAVLIPLPHAGSHEQEANAKALAGYGLAIVLPQDKLSGALLLAKLREILEKIDEIKKYGKSARLLVKTDAAERILTLIEEQWQKD